MKTKEYRLTFSVWIEEEYGERREIVAERQISTYRVPAGYVFSDYEKEHFKDYLWDKIKELDRSGRNIGEWIQNDNGTWSCSFCHDWISNDQHYHAKYCPCCGAAMKLE